jgi:hypothetical protein
MRDFGTVRPGTTLYVPFHTFDSNDPSASVTITGLAVTDIEIYKNGSTTQRASDTGYALLDTDGIDFDGVTGIHGFSLDLSSNATAGFFTAGAQFWVVVSAITVDAATINFVAATFRVGYPGAILDTTIATLSTQTSFTLTAGPADDTALVGCVVCIHDIASAVQLGFGVVSAYTGSTLTVTLTAGVSFTAAAGDHISVFPPANAAWGGAVAYTATRGLAGTALPAAAADGAGGLPISDAGGLDLDTQLADTHEVTAARMGALTDWIDGGRLDLLLDAILADTNELQSDDTPGALSAIDAKIDTIDDFLDTEIAAILEDTGTTLDDMVDDLEDRLTDALATQLAAHSLGVLRGVVDAGSSTTEVIVKSINGGAADATNDHYNGRHIVFTSGALFGQATDITDYVGATVTATVSAVTDTPAEDVTFIIV